MKICGNLGCGGDIHPSTEAEQWVNIDAYVQAPGVVPDDVRELRMVPDEHFDHLLAQDVLEHIPWPQAQATLGVWWRKLKPSGSLTIRVPDVDKQIQCYLAGVWSIEQFTHMLLAPMDHPGNIHHNVFSRQKLDRMLRIAGFSPLNWWYEQHNLDNTPHSHNANLGVMAMKTPGKSPP